MSRGDLDCLLKVQARSMRACRKVPEEQVSALPRVAMQSIAERVCGAVD